MTHPTVFVLHTSFALVDVLKKLFAQHLGGVRMVNIVDDSLLADVRTAGHVIPSVTRRMIGYAQLAQSAGAAAIFNSCSSVGEVADLMRSVVDIPVVKIDDRMAEEAALAGQRVAVIATVPTTLDPTRRLVERKAASLGRSVTVRPYLVEGAFDALMSGDPARHDEMVSEAIRRAASEADAVALAQGSMARLVPALAPELRVPLLSSPERGVLELRDVLGSRL